jgi:flavin-dependent dehydrogenase
VPDTSRDHLPDRVVDVAVVGAGPAGCAAAATLARVGRPVVLLDGVSSGFRIGEGAAPGVGQLIEEIFGDEQAFTPDAHLPCPSIVSAWGSAEPQVVDHIFNPLGHAWNLDRARFDGDLRAAAARLGAEVVRKRVRDVDARVVIDTSGTGAIARRRGAIRRQVDRLVALWSVWEGGDDSAYSLYLEAAANGWWYSVLLPGGRRLVAFLTDANLLQADRAAVAESARSLPLVGSLLGATARIAVGPTVCSARTGWLEPLSGHGWLSAGDAACSLDPLSGRGIVAALLTGRTAGLAAEALLAGDGREAVDEHERSLNEMLDDGLEQRAAAYADESRWAESEFWARRVVRRPVRG